MRAGIVWNDTEGTNGIAENCTVEIGDDVRTAAIAGDDDIWAEVSRAHLPVQGFFDFRVSDED